MLAAKSAFLCVLVHIKMLCVSTLQYVCQDHGQHCLWGAVFGPEKSSVLKERQYYLLFRFRGFVRAPHFLGFGINKIQLQIYNIYFLIFVLTFSH